MHSNEIQSFSSHPKENFYIPNSIVTHYLRIITQTLSNQINQDI